MDFRDIMCRDVLVVVHIDGPSNPVDVGTKKDRAEEAFVVLNRILYEGLRHPRDSQDFKHT